MGNKMSKPEVRDRLRELAEEHGIEELNFLADQLYRQYKTGRTPTKSPECTPEMAEAIREYRKANPEAPQHEIASIFGVNHGRVSEALNGLR